MNNPHAAHSKSLSRRKFLQSAGAMLAGTLLVACAPNLASPTPSVATPLPPKPSTPSPPLLSPPTPAGPPTAVSQSTLGTGRGIFPGRVVWVHHPEAAHWDGSSGLWWQEQNTSQGAVAEMLSQAIRTQSGQKGDPSAWDALFRHFNQKQGRSGVGYQPGEKIAIKLNLNACEAHNYQKNGSFTAPQLVLSLVKQLVEQAGVPAESITLYDALRYIPDAIYQPLKANGLTGVHCVDWTGGAGREKAERDLSQIVHWSEDVKGSTTYLPTCVTQANYLINLASMKGHNLAGVTLCAKNHFGTIQSDLEGKPTQQAPQGANLHGTIAAHYFGWGEGWTWQQRPMNTYNALVDLMGHPHLGEKTILFMLDALYVAKNQSAEIDANSRWQSAPFNGTWPSSIFVSQDNLAIDSVGLDFLSSEPTILAEADVLPPGHTAENYLHEAAMLPTPPSGIRYDPVNSGSPLSSLGVHEHWNNASERNYSRNQGASEGIELVKVG
jgi:hypothetical protein